MVAGMVRINYGQGLDARQKRRQKNTFDHFWHLHAGHRIRPKFKGLSMTLQQHGWPREFVSFLAGPLTIWILKMLGHRQNLPRRSIMKYPKTKIKQTLLKLMSMFWFLGIIFGFPLTRLDFSSTNVVSFSCQWKNLVINYWPTKKNRTERNHGCWWSDIQVEKSRRPFWSWFLQKRSHPA